MEKPPKNVQPPEERFDPQMESFKYQLELLKLEIQSINETIGRIDKITQEAKNWAIVTWAGSIAIALGGTVPQKIHCAYCTIALLVLVY